MIVSRQQSGTSTLGINCFWAENGGGWRKIAHRRAKKRKRGEYFDQKDVFLCVKLCFVVLGVLGHLRFWVENGGWGVGRDKKTHKKSKNVSLF